MGEIMKYILSEDAYDYIIERFLNDEDYTSSELIKFTLDISKGIDSNIGYMWHDGVTYIEFKHKKDLTWFLLKI
jgi:hypothetical protein